MLSFTAQALLLCLGLETMHLTPRQATWRPLWLSQENALKCNQKACPDHIEMSGAILDVVVPSFCNAAAAIATLRVSKLVLAAIDGQLRKAQQAWSCPILPVEPLAAGDEAWASHDGQVLPFCRLLVIWATGSQTHGGCATWPRYPAPAATGNLWPGHAATVPPPWASKTTTANLMLRTWTMAPKAEGLPAVAAGVHGIDPQ